MIMCYFFRWRRSAFPARTFLVGGGVYSSDAGQHYSPPGVLYEAMRCVTMVSSLRKRVGLSASLLWRIWKDGWRHSGGARCPPLNVELSTSSWFPGRPPWPEVAVPRLVVSRVFRPVTLICPGTRWPTRLVGGNPILAVDHCPGAAFHRSTTSRRGPGPDVCRSFGLQSVRRQPGCLRPYGLPSTGRRRRLDWTHLL